MYKITWDNETGGILLNLKVVDNALSVAPRPVFWEELDLLGLAAQGWRYPHCDDPLMWACNKQYFYRGQHIFDAQGANIYDAPKVILQKGVEPMKLVPVNMAKMLSRNKDPMFLMESEAIDFIRDTYIAYSAATKSVERVAANKIDFEALTVRLEKKAKQKMAIVRQDCDSFDIMPLDQANEQGKRVFQTTKIDYFLASFSGGKDSQVVLDLCTRAIPPSAFQVIYSDTGYELPSSLDLYKEVQEFYGKKFPDLKFSTAKNHESVLNYWDKIGTPTDSHRWCCSIMKTAPLYRILKLPDSNKQGKVLAFDGVRAEESNRRSGYMRIGKGKHTNVFNAHPILNWNTAEIFLYLFKYGLTINPAYRFGKARVGCLICPFSTAWDDMIVSRFYPAELKPFTDKLDKWAKASGIKDTQEYLKERKWKIKALGDNIISAADVVFPQSQADFIAVMTHPALPIYHWLPAACEFEVQRKGNIDKGQLKFKDSVYSFQVEYSSKDGKVKFTVFDCIDSKAVYLLRRVVYKSAYCVQCEVCEVDCPTGALSIVPSVNIDKTKCIRCHKCLDAHDRGCIATDCIRMIKDSDKKVNAKVQAYKTFGLREDWINEFFSDVDGFWLNNSLGSAQVDGFKAWLKDAEITDLKNQLTPFGKLLQEIYIDDINLTWELILTNLAYHSFIVNWFANNVPIGQSYDKKSLEDKIVEQGIDASKKTIENAVAALTQMFSYSPVGELLRYRVPITGKNFVREEYEDITEVGLAYSLYKYAEMKGVRSLRVSDFYSSDCDNGPAVILGTSIRTFEKALRTLNSTSNRVLVAELNMGLDNITLREDLTSISVIEALVR